MEKLPEVLMLLAVMHGTSVNANTFEADDLYHQVCRGDDPRGAHMIMNPRDDRDNIICIPYESWDMCRSQMKAKGSTLSQYTDRYELRCRYND